MSKPMTHLEAFMSDDAKRGRGWTDGCSDYKRHYDQLWIDAHKDGNWKFYDEQVAAMDDDVTWVADEPKTLTPQEALRALADGKCIACSATPYRLGRLGMEYWSPMRRWVSNDFHFGEITGKTWRECPDPSQPAEPHDDDKVKRVPGCECHLEVGDSPCRVHGEDAKAVPEGER